MPCFFGNLARRDHRGVGPELQVGKGKGKTSQQSSALLKHDKSSSPPGAALLSSQWCSKSESSFVAVQSAEHLARAADGGSRNLLLHQATGLDCESCVKALAAGHQALPWAAAAPTSPEGIPCWIPGPLLVQTCPQKLTPFSETLLPAR